MSRSYSEPSMSISLPAKAAFLGALKLLALVIRHPKTPVSFEMGSTSLDPQWPSRPRASSSSSAGINIQPLTPAQSEALLAAWDRVTADPTWRSRPAKVTSSASAAQPRVTR